MAKVLSADHESVRYGNVKEFWMRTVDHVYYHNCEVCIFVAQVYVILVPTGSPSCGGDVAVYVLDIKQPSLPISFHSVLVSYDPFIYTLFHKFSRQLSAFSLCSSGLISALLVLSTVYLFMKVFFSSDVILCG